MNKICCYLLSVLLLLLPVSLNSQGRQEGYTVNFNNVSVKELIRFVSRVAEVNFIVNEDLLNFDVSLISGRELSKKEMVDIMVQILKQHNLRVIPKANYYIIESGYVETKQTGSSHYLSAMQTDAEEHPFYVYKLQYNAGEEIEAAIKQMGAQDATSLDLKNAIHSLKWIPATNSLLYNGTPKGRAQLTGLIKSLDVQQKQVFIDILVIETDVKSGLDFGLQWAFGGKYKNFGFGTGNFPAHGKPSPFAKTFQGIDASNPPTGPNQIPLGRGFDLGVIGDVILHKGASFLSLGSLVSALEADGNTTIILNQKIIAQDHRKSTVFVGDNIPFTGSIVETVGASQQTTSNIEYRDVGVNLNITPLLGDNDMITLEISEEISEAIPSMLSHNTTQGVNGIQTTKTNMLTRAHVPDQRFLVLSGMVRNSHTKQRSGLPCLGGLPVIGKLFAEHKKSVEKRNVIIFVRPQIIHSYEDHQEITDRQEALFQEQSGSPDLVEEAIETVDTTKEAL